MIVDASQATLNKTAMFAITHDTVAALAPLAPRLQYFGQVFDRAPASRLLDSLRQEGLRRILGETERLIAELPPRNLAEDETVLYLDPLYVLFGGLTRNDTVMVLDLSTVTHPHWHNPSVSVAYQAAFALIALKRPHLLAISANTADSLRANYGVAREAIDVVPLYVPDHLTEDGDDAPIHVPFPYVLFVGSLESRKNVVGAIAIFAASGLAQRGHRLLVVGGGGHGDAEIMAFGAQSAAVVFCGYVSNAELRSLYAAAAAFLYPSYLEGFGVPLLEALSFGIPAVASSTGACPEVGGPLVRTFDPDDHAGFAHELVRLVNLNQDERAAYRAAARRWIEDRYTRALFARRIADIMEARESARRAG